MTFLKEGKTNWKYILIVVILALIVGGGILGYSRWLAKEKIPSPPVVKKTIPPECIGPSKGPIIEEGKEIKTVYLPIDAPKSENILGYLFSEYYDIPPRDNWLLVIPLDYNDPLFKREEEVANYLHDLGFSVGYSNVVYALDKGYSFRLSLKGCIELFESRFRMSIKSHKDEKGRIIIDSFTTPRMPDEIRDFARTLEYPPPPEHFPF